MMQNIYCLKILSCCVDFCGFNLVITLANLKFYLKEFTLVRNLCPDPRHAKGLRRALHAMARTKKELHKYGQNIMKSEFWKGAVNTAICFFYLKKSISGYHFNFLGWREGQQTYCQWTSIYWKGYLVNMPISWVEGRLTDILLMVIDQMDIWSLG